MFKLLGNALKVSPVLFGVSIFVAGSSYAAQTNVELNRKKTTTTQAMSAIVNAEPENPSPQLEIKNPQALATNQISVEKPATEFNNSLTQPINLAETSPAAEVTTPNERSEILEQINRYSPESDPLDQVTNVSQLQDVSPGDWAFEALRSLVERYGCIAGYPDGTFRGNRATSRFEFAAGLNACLNQVERLIQTSTADFVRKSDLETLQRLVTEFRTELTTLGARVDKLEGRTAFLENRQFSTTTKLNGQALFFIGNAFGDRQAVPSGFAPGGKLRSNTTFSDRLRLNLATSFTGQDLLRTRLQARNFTGFVTPTGTQMAEFGQQGDEGNSVRVSKLFYQTPIGKQIIVYGGSIFDLDDVAPTTLSGSAIFGEFLSDFMSYSPIYKMGGGAGGGIAIGVNSPIRIDAMYAAGGDSGANDPRAGSGLFNGSYAALGQITFQPSPALQVIASYLHAYGNSPAGFDGSIYGNAPFGVITRRLDPDGNPLLVAGNPVFDAPGSSGVRTTTTNAYNLSASYQFGSAFAIAGTVGYSTALNEVDRGAGTRKLWTYAASVAFLDIGGAGNILGLGFGMPPRSRTGRTDRPGDLGTTYQAEVFYKYKLNNNIAITPGLFILLNPEHNNNNSDIYIGAIRTEFLF